MIGTTAAILGGALISGGLGLAASKSNSKSIDKTVVAQQQSADRQIQFQQQARAENTAALSPWMSRGNAAAEQYSALIGAPGGGNAQNAALAAYETFKQSTGYQTRLNEGNASIRANYSAMGVNQSGARDKALARFNQDYASNEFGNYMGALDNQQRLGFGAASALAGVSQTFADRASDISQNGANVAGQAAIARAQNQGALFTGLANTAGQAFGSLSSYRPYNYAALGPDVSRTIAANPALF